MLFSQIVRYPTHTDIYANAGETKEVDSSLVPRMLKRGAVLVEETKAVEPKKVEEKKEVVVEESKVEVEETKEVVKTSTKKENKPNKK